MAGIAGSVYTDIYHIHHYMDEMLDTLSHRGPITHTELTRDVLSYKNVKIGASGSRTGSNPKQSIISVFDGSLYNKPEIIQLLNTEGHNIAKEASAADLIVYAYLTWGETFANRLDGEFTCALLDKNKEYLLLYRDRVGIKPLYWYQKEGQLLFASELKALLATQAIAQTPAPDALAVYLALGYIPSRYDTHSRSQQTFTCPLLEICLR